MAVLTVRRRRLPWWFWFGLALALIALIASLVASRSGRATEPHALLGGAGVQVQVGVDAGKKPLLVTSVAAAGLGPGAPVRMTVTIANQEAQQVVLTSVIGSVLTVGSGSRPTLLTCDRRWYRIGSFTGRTSIAKGGRTTVTLPVTFDNLPVNQDNCKGAIYTYTLTATGTKG